MAVRAVTGDTDLTPVDLGSYSSRVTLMMGNAAIQAAERARELIAEGVSAKLQVPKDRLVFAGRRVFDTENPETGCTFQEAVCLAEAKFGTLGTTGSYTPPKSPARFKGGGVGPSPTYSYTAAVVEVDVDPETGWITVPRIWVAHDIGRALNPTLVRGQVEGGVYMGLGEALMEGLQRHKIGQTVRDDGPGSHLPKAGTPTMGGTLILLALTISTLLWADLSSAYVWIVVLVTLAYGLIGFVDDYRKLVRRDPKGLSAKAKFLWQALVGLVAAVVLFTLADRPQETALMIPYLKNLVIPLGWFYVVLTFFVIVGTSNAVNLTDGLDGLAIMPSVMVAGALGVASAGWGLVTPASVVTAFAWITLVKLPLTDMVTRMVRTQLSAGSSLPPL